MEGVYCFVFFYSCLHNKCEYAERVGCWSWFIGLQCQATRQLRKSPACSWRRAARCSSPCSAALEVEHTADGSRMAGATVDSQIKHTHNEDKYWPRHRLKKRWDERREGQGNAGGLIIFFIFFFQNQNLVRYSDQVELWSGTEREGADVTPRLTSKRTKQQSVVLLGAFLIPASALISL